MPREVKKEFYLGNKNLPTQHAEFDYSDNPNWIQNLNKCRSNILYFAENFFFIINLDKGKMLIELHKYQKRILKTLRDNRFVIMLSSRQSGKALALDTPIPSPTGWRTMGDLKDGDIVYDMHGRPCAVVQVHDIMHNRDCYEVEFDNGEKIVADGEHLWFTQTRRDRIAGSDGSVRSTVEIKDTLNAGGKREEPNHRIPTVISGVTGEHRDLPIDPYVLGMWLGDGCADTSTITVGKRDVNDLIDILKTQCKQFDKLVLHEYKDGVYSLRITVKEKVKSNSLNTLLRSTNLLGNKHIPPEYLLASREQRLELLRGLIDSDGYIDDRGNANFYNTNQGLVLQTKKLVESLGYKVTYKTYIPKLNGVECKESGVLCFKPIEYVCKLAFKRNRIKCREFINDTSLRSQWHYIKSVKKVESVPVRCITVDSPGNLYLCGNQYIPTHNTTIMTIYALWIACFQEDQRILVVANKELTAINIFKRIRMAYEQLPNYLKPGVIEYGKTSMTLANGSSIGISTTSSDAGRGDSCNVLILDELAFIDNHMVTEFWRSVYPIISSSQKSKIFIASTPNGSDNLFYDLYKGAEKNNNGWTGERVDWWEVPGRDEDWKANTIKSLGSSEAFSQEFCNVFLKTGESVVDESLFEKLKEDIKEPAFIFDDGHYLVWEPPSQDKIYVAGVDVSEGVGQAASVIQIFDITDLKNIEQVAVYHNNTINPIQFIAKCLEVFQNWGNPPACIERNNCGSQVVDQLRAQHSYQNIVSYGPKIGSNVYARLGILAHTNTKYKGVMNMRYYLNELRAVKIRDIRTLTELRNFVRSANGTWGAAAGSDSWDDRVMSLIWALIILENELADKYFEIIDKDANERPLLIKRFDYGIREFIDPTQTLINLKTKTELDLPILISGDNYTSPYDVDIEQLRSDGWRMPDEPHDSGWRTLNTNSRYE